MAETTEQDQQKNPELIRLLQSGTKSESETTSTPSKNANSSECEWTVDETTCLLKLIAEYEYVSQIKSENDQVYTKVVEASLVSQSGADSRHIVSGWCRSTEYENGSFHSVIFGTTDYLRELERHHSETIWRLSAPLWETRLASTTLVYTKLSKLMTISGHKKTNEEIKACWKDLKQKYEGYKAGKLDQFDYVDQVSGLLDLNSSSHSEPEIIIIKGEELESNILHSADSLGSNFCSEDYEPKNGRGIRRNNWTHKETECVVEVLEKYGMPNRTNLRKFCYVIVDYLKQHEFSRSEEQAQVKIKHLRALYNQVVRKSLKEEEFPFFKRIEALMHNHQILKEKDCDETQNYITLDEQSKSDVEDNTGADFNNTVVNEEEETCYKKGRQIWTNKEIRVLLKFIEENGVVTGKQLRKVCNKAVDYLASHGYYRSATQILIRWKNTKALYWATFRKKSKVPVRECSFFYQLHAILNPDDCTYEAKNFEETGDDDEEANFYQSSENISSLESNAELSNFHFNKVSHGQSNFNFKRDNFITLQNSSNSNDNFISVHNGSNSKRFHIAELPIDPLVNGDCGKVTPSSPKRSRIEQAEPVLRTSCSFCNSLDPIDHYCISLAHSIKKLDARKQAKLKIEIQQLMYKAEFDSDF